MIHQKVSFRIQERTFRIFLIFMFGVSLVLTFLTYNMASFGSDYSEQYLEHQIKVLRSVEKLSRYVSHTEFMSRCVNLSIIPKGMSVKFGSSALPHDSSLHDGVSKTLNGASRDILILCRDTYKKLAERENSNFDSLMYNAFQSLDYNDFEKLWKVVRTSRNQLRTDLSHGKAKKIENICRNSDGTTQVPIKSKRQRHFYRNKRQTPIQDNKSVVNLSSVNLTEDQTKVLSLGPKFCPTPSSLNQEQLCDDIEEGCRRVRLKELFHDNEEPTSREVPKFYKKTFYTPPDGRDNHLDTYCSILKDQATSFKPSTNIKDNLCRKERLALKQLRDMVTARKIRISSADKGGAVVVQDTSTYITEAMRQLEDIRQYEVLADNPTSDICETSNTMLTSLHRKCIIDDNTLRWGTLEPTEVRTHTFYHLPKIHKSLENTPGRPIISGIQGPTEKLSKLADFWLRPVVEKLPSYVKDTNDMLRCILTWNDEYGNDIQNFHLVSLDVVGLYSNIPHDDVIEAITHYCELFPLDLPPLDDISSVVNHVLSNNVFTFENVTYKQIHGTAMGTPMAPSVANLVMGRMGENILKNSPVFVDPRMRKRYIDDILLLWTGSMDDLTSFLSFVNTVHPNIKFTSHTSSTGLPFLGIFISVVNGLLSTDMYIKDTDYQNYIHYKSCHPKHCLNNIP